MPPRWLWLAAALSAALAAAVALPGTAAEPLRVESVRVDVRHVAMAAPAPKLSFAHCLGGDGLNSTVAREAARKGWPCRVAHRPVGSGRNGLQAEARGVRYRWLGELAGQIPNAYILTAQNAQEQAESVVLHWLRAADPVAALRKKVRSDRGSRPSLSEALKRAIHAQHRDHATWTKRLHYDNLVVLGEGDPGLLPLPSCATVRRYESSVVASSSSSVRPLTRM